MSHQNSGTPDFTAVTDAWTSMTQSFFQSATAANRAAVSAMLPTATSSQSTDGCASDETVPASIPSVDHSNLEWEFDRTVDDREDIGVGDTVTFEKTLTEDDVRAFAEISGDTNRLHLDEEFAEKTRFGERIVHGTLVSGLISAALARLPGLTIYLSQDLEFSGPVGIGDTVSARVEVVENLGKGQFRLETVIRNESDDAMVIDGEAVVLIDEQPDA
ncbi:MaoC family dehydratase [Natronobacterium texcoconense]|uniref:Acyl dehydratase n=1 Tax=Natronobacterium texcoconense TaxID=1095778 RepID=A0A1H1C525_NATTX|nr:MaoC family dehydratase [Natronobacterium texcoconense]SDQ59282.1 Acyl dehydratase [Natronobacterium texcoconense]